MQKNSICKMLMLCAIVFMAMLPVRQAIAAKSTISKSPYLGAICVDAATGKVLFEDNPDAQGYPASMVKLMDLMVILDYLKAGSIHLEDQVTVTAEAARIGGSQVYLKEHEVFSIEELLYTIMVQSANDSATALAIHIAGTKDAFVVLMNEKAKQLGMTSTTFHSVHGLPPSKGQQPDVTTPRDMAKLCMELIKHEDTFKYTATTERAFRPDLPEPFIMRSHNHLLRNMEGCDGLKTGYFFNAGFSISATATRKGTRAIVVVLGSENRKVRDAKAKEILSLGLIELVKNAPPPAAPPVVPVVAQAGMVVAGPENAAAPVEASLATPEKTADDDYFRISKRSVQIFGGVVFGIVMLIVIITYIRQRQERNRPVYFRRR